jgi:hypothetical protein
MFAALKKTACAFIRLGTDVIVQSGVRGLKRVSEDAPSALGTFIAVAALFLGLPAFGQVEIALTVEPVRALLYEPIYAKVVIRNNTGGILPFDAGPGSARFFFEVERNKNNVVKQNDRAPLFFGIKLVPDGSATNVFNLISLYDMSSRGLYKVRACLEWNNLLFSSQPVELEMLKGFEIARMIAGVPGEQPAMRIYILEYLAQERGEQVYLRIEDANSSTIYGMHKLGYIVRIRKPEMKADEAGNVHVLFQTMAMVFVHAAFTPYGVQLFSRNYADKSNMIALVNLPNGQVSVAPLLPKEQDAAGNDPAATKSAPKVRLGHGGLFGTKAE